MNATDFYYKLNAKGGRNYYCIYTDKKVAKKKINPNILDDIKEKNIKIDNYKKIMDLISKRNKLQEKVKLLNDELGVMNDELSNIGINTKKDEEYIAEFIKKYMNDLEKQKTKDIPKQEAPKTETKNEPEVKQETISDELPRCTSTYVFPSGTLKSKHINTKKEWFEWLSRNHVDKGGDIKICADVISEGRSRGW